MNRVATAAFLGISLPLAIALVAFVVVIALAFVVLMGVRPRQRPGRRTAHNQRIQDAAAADVAAVEQDAADFESDAPGHDEDEL